MKNKPARNHSTTGFRSIRPPSSGRWDCCVPEAVLEANAEATLTQSEMDLRTQEKITEGQSLSPVEASLRRLGRDRRAMVCLAIILVMVTASYVFPIVYLHMGPVIQGGITDTSQVPPELYHYMIHQELLDLDAPSSLAHPLGTDQLGT